METIVERCNLCQTNDETVVDGLCDKCEAVWLDKVAIVSKQVSNDTSIRSLFEQATILAKQHIDLTKNKK